MKVNIIARTNGKGYWTEEEREVLISKLDLGYKSTDYYPEDPFHGELRAYFDGSGFGTGSWNIHGYGLIYTDRQWLKEFKAGLRKLGFSIKAVQNIGYSEQGMQSDCYVSMDVGPAFYASWQRMEKKIKNWGDDKLLLDEVKA